MTKHKYRHQVPKFISDVGSSGISVAARNELVRRHERGLSNWNLNLARRRKFQQKWGKKQIVDEDKYYKIRRKRSKYTKRRSTSDRIKDFIYKPKQLNTYQISRALFEYDQFKKAYNKYKESKKPFYSIPKGTPRTPQYITKKVWDVDTQTYRDEQVLNPHLFD